MRQLVPAQIADSACCPVMPQPVQTPLSERPSGEEGSPQGCASSFHSRFHKHFLLKVCLFKNIILGGGKSPYTGVRFCMVVDWVRGPIWIIIVFDPYGLHVYLGTWVTSFI